jgi:hypothetical protein
MIGEKCMQQGQEQRRGDWYEVELEGCISHQWFDCLDGWETTLLPNGNTLLSGWIRDQPALHGLFARIRDINIRIISLKSEGDRSP